MKIIYKVVIFMLLFYSGNSFSKEAPLPGFVKDFFYNPTVLGSHRLYYFGFNLYDIQTIVEKSDLKKKDRSKIAVQLQYNRDISKQDLIDSSFEEMAQASGVNEDEIIQKYQKTFENIYSEIKKGDQKVAILKDKALYLYYNSILLGKVEDEFFATNFLGMWLDKKASRQKMRKKLLNI